MIKTGLGYFITQRLPKTGINLVASLERGMS